MNNKFDFGDILGVIAFIFLMIAIPYLAISGQIYFERKVIEISKDVDFINHIKNPSFFDVNKKLCLWTLANKDTLGSNDKEHLIEYYNTWKYKRDLMVSEKEKY